MIVKLLTDHHLEFLSKEEGKDQESIFLLCFCYALLCVHSSFSIILKRKRKLVALLLLSYR